MPQGDVVALDALDCELTERCNLRCAHCYIRTDTIDTRGTPEEVDLPLLRRVLSEAKSLGCRRVTLTGGEPLLRADFTEAYDIAWDLGLSVSIASNGTLFTPAIAEALGRKRPERISISLYGWDSQSFRCVTGVDVFEHFLVGVGFLVARRLPVSFRYPAVPLLTRNAGRIRRLAYQIGGRTPIEYPWDLTLSARPELRQCERIQSVRLDPKEAAEERLKEPGEAVRLTGILLHHRSQARDDRLFACRAPARRLGVDAYGHLLLCPGVRQSDLTYAIRSGSLRDAIAGHFRKIAEMRYTNLTFLSRCGRCLLRRVCRPCPASAYTESGSLDVPPAYYCDVSHEVARLLGFLRNGEKGWQVSRLFDPAGSGATEETAEERDVEHQAQRAEMKNMEVKR